MRACSRSPVRTGCVGHRREGESAPPASRGPQGILEQLMASSPKPPKWAAKSREVSMCEDGTDLSSDVDVGQKSHLLGKWARGSQVGAQVRSTTDLCCLNASSGSCGQSTAQSSTHRTVTKEVSHRISAGSAGTASAEQMLRGSDARPWQF